MRVEENTANDIMKSGKSVGPVLGGLVTGGGVYAIKQLMNKVDGSAEDVHNHVEKVKALSDAAGLSENEETFQIVPSELVEAMFNLPLEENKLEDKIKNKTFTAFGSFNKYIKG